MAFDVADITISTLFKSDFTFEIPRYQRKYVWTNENWKQLLKDIEYCAETNPKWSHFIGSVVFEKQNQDSGKVQIIDGQQRVITFQIIIYAIIYKFQKIALNSEPAISEKCKMNIDYLKDLIITKAIGAASSPKLIVQSDSYHMLNNDMFTIEGLNLEAFEKKINKLNKDKPDKILLAFLYFSNHIIDFNFNATYEFYKQLMSTRVVTIASLQEEEVYNIFEILNARGVKLKEAELLKNFMFKYLKPTELLDNYKKQWRELERILDESDLDIDDYYFHFYKCFSNQKNVKKNILFDSTKEFLMKDPKILMNNFFDVFISSSVLYINICKVIGSNIEMDVYEYFSLKNNKQIRPVLLSLKLKESSSIINQNNYNDLLKLIKNYFIAFNLENSGSNIVEKDIYSLANNIYSANNHLDINLAIYEFLNKYIIYYSSTDTFKTGLSRLAFSNRTSKRNITSKLLIHFFKPIVLEAEKNKFINYEFQNFNIEHILNDSDTDDIHYELGNLIPCPISLNEEMKNKNYDFKKGKLKASEIGYLVKFANDYDDFDISKVKKRTTTVSEEIIKYHKLDHIWVKKEFENLKLAKNLIVELVSKFGVDNNYSKLIIDKGVDKFAKFIANNKELPSDDVSIIHEVLDKYQLI